MRAMRGVPLKDRGGSTDLMFLLGLNEIGSVGYGKQCSLAWSCVEVR